MTDRRFVALDRDGTIIVERHYLSDPAQVELLPGAAEGLRQLGEMGLGLIVLTNQSAIGRGFFDEARLTLIHQRMRALLEAEGVFLDRIYYCPHTPEDHCLCRKPHTGLFELAAKELNFDPRTSFVIGDKPCDIELGRNVGAVTFLVRTGYGEKMEAEGMIRPDYIVDNLKDAALMIQSLFIQDKRMV